MKKRMQKVLSVGVGIMMLSLAVTGCGNAEITATGTTSEGAINTSSEQIELTYYCIPDPAGIVPKKVALFNEEYPNVKVNVVELPNDASERLTTISTAMQAKDSSVDVFDFDTTYPQMFNESGWLAPLSDTLSEEDIAAFYPGAIEANTYNGEVYSLPLYIDAGILYYRSDLLEKYGHEVPETWEDVIAISKDITAKEESITGGISMQWKQFEGLTCSAAEIMWSFGADILDEEGNVVINSPETKAAIELMAELKNEDNLTVDGVTSFTVVESRVPFYSGNAIFLRDWSSAYVGAQDEENSNVVGKVGFTTLPVGSENGTNNSCLGGWSVGVSAFSDHPEEAKALVTYLAGEEGQKMEAIANAKMPSRPAVLEDAEVKEAVPYIVDMVEISELTKSRPKSAYYAEISSAIQTEISSVLAGSTDVETACVNMQKQIEEIASR